MGKFLILVKTRQCKVKGSKYLPVEAHGSRGLRAPPFVYILQKNAGILYFLFCPKTRAFAIAIVFS